MFFYCSVTGDAKYVCFACVIMLCGYGKRGTHRTRYMHMGAMDPPHIILILRLFILIYTVFSQKNHNHKTINCAHIDY